MSSHQSYSYTSSSYSTSSSTDSSGTTKTYSERVSSNNRDGTTIERRTEETGKPTYVEREEHPAPGSRRIGTSSTDGQGRIEDVTDREASEADKRYEENIEDEYAKREGGA